MVKKKNQNKSTRRVLKSTRQKLSRASKSYWKVRKAVKKYWQKEGKELSPKELTEYTRKIYPIFKGEANYEIKVADVYEAIVIEETGLAIQEPQNFANPLLVDTSSISGVGWYDIDDTISVQLASQTGGQNLRFEVNAGEYGSTGIIELSSYTYEGSGVQDIVEMIRDIVKDDSEPYWEGEVVVREGFQDDGDPNSYYIQFTLYIAGRRVNPVQTKEPQTPKRKLLESIEEKRARRQKITERRKELQEKRKERNKQKKLRNRKRPTVKKKVTDADKKALEEQYQKLLAEKKKAEEAANAKKVKKTKKPITIPTGQTKGESLSAIYAEQNKTLDRLEKMYNNKIISKKQYAKMVQEVIDTTQEAVQKFKKGGEV